MATQSTPKTTLPPQQAPAIFGQDSYVGVEPMAEDVEQDAYSVASNERPIELTLSEPEFDNLDYHLDNLLSEKVGRIVDGVLNA